MAVGAFCLVLHGHLPWVLHHGRWPHGEDWIYEAAARTWLPLIGVLRRLEADGLEAAWTVGMTPVLLEQLDHPRFQDGFERYLLDRAERARRDAVELEGRGDAHLAWLAAEHERLHVEMVEQFRALDRSIPQAMKIGRAHV